MDIALGGTVLNGLVRRIKFCGAFLGRLAGKIVAMGRPSESRSDQDIVKLGRKPMDCPWSWIEVAMESDINVCGLYCLSRFLSTGRSSTLCSFLLLLVRFLRFGHVFGWF